MAGSHAAASPKSLPALPLELAPLIAAFTGDDETVDAFLQALPQVFTEATWRDIHLRVTWLVAYGSHWGSSHMLERYLRRALRHGAAEGDVALCQALLSHPVASRVLMRTHGNALSDALIAAAVRNQEPTMQLLLCWGARLGPRVPVCASLLARRLGLPHPPLRCCKEAAIEAAAEGDVGWLEQLFGGTHGLDSLTAYDARKVVAEALWAAVGRGQLDAVAWLLAHHRGRLQQFDLDCALSEVADSGLADTAALADALFRAGAKATAPGLAKAAQQGRLDWMRALLAAAPRPLDAQLAMDCAAGRLDLPIARALLADQSEDVADVLRARAVRAACGAPRTTAAQRWQFIRCMIPSEPAAQWPPQLRGALLQAAAGLGRLQTVESLVPHVVGAQQGTYAALSALVAAAGAGHERIVWCLLAAGVEDDEDRAITAAAKKGHLHVVHLMLADPGCPPHPKPLGAALDAAVVSGHMALALWLLDGQGAPVSSIGCEAMKVAMLPVHKAFLDALISRAFLEDASPDDTFWDRLVETAAEAGRADVLRTLASKGVHIVSETALRRAASARQIGALRVLLAGAGTSSSDGDLPSHASAAAPSDDGGAPPPPQQESSREDCAASGSGSDSEGGVREEPESDGALVSADDDGAAWQPDDAPVWAPLRTALLVGVLPAMQLLLSAQPHDNRVARHAVLHAAARFPRGATVRALLRMWPDLARDGEAVCCALWYATGSYQGLCAVCELLVASAPHQLPIDATPMDASEIRRLYAFKHGIIDGEAMEHVLEFATSCAGRHDGGGAADSLAVLLTAPMAHRARAVSLALGEWKLLTHGTELLRYMLKALPQEQAGREWGGVQRQFEQAQLPELAAGTLEDFIARRGVYKHDI